MRRLAALFPIVLPAAALAQPDSYHLMQIEQVCAGVHGDTTRQLIQLRQRFPFQNFIAGTTLRAFDAAGQNPIILITFPGNVANGDEGDRILIASPGWTPPVTPDFVMPAPIPASYLAAGKLVFADAFEHLFLLCYGGAAYTGSTTGSLANDLDGNYGPPFDGPLPTGSNTALLFQGPASAPSTSNNADFAITSGPATFTNNARASGQLPTGGCYANCDQSTTAPVLNVADFSCFLQKFAGNDPYANCDGSTTAPALNVADFSCFLQKFAGGCP